MSEGRVDAVIAPKARVARLSQVARALVVIAVLVTVAVIARTPTPSGASAGPDPTGTVYVADYGTSSIDVFAAGSNGNVAPIRTIAGALTGISGPGDVAVDPAGHVYSSNFDASTITEYAPGASGNVAPICTIGGSNTGLGQNDDISLAPDGTLYVGNFGGSAPVEVFAPGACGNVAPIRTLSGVLTGLSAVDGVGVDAVGNFYAANDGGISAFAPGANGNVAPTHVISGSATGLSSPDDVKVGFGGNLYVSDENGSVETFAAGATGNAAPLTSISGSNTGLVIVDDLAVDSVGKTYVTNFSTAGVVEFAAGATGNVAPIATLSGSLTTFAEPEGIVVAGPPGKVSASLTSAVVSPSISLGSPTHDTATLAGGTTPTGSLIFKLFGPGDSTCTGAPAYTSPVTTITGDKAYTSPSFTPTKTGTYSWVDLYSGDSNNAPVSTACGDPTETVTVSASTKNTDTTVLNFGSAPTYTPQSPVAPGNNESLAAYVNPNGVKNPGSGVTAPTGSIAFFDGATHLSTVAVNGYLGSAYANLSTSLAIGSHEITAVYSGDGNYPASTSNQVQITVATGAKLTATATPTTVGLNFGSAPTYTQQSPVSHGNRELFTATVTKNGVVNPGPLATTPGPTGTVTFYDGTTALGTAAVSSYEGSSYVSLPTTGLSVGSHEITAHYNGDTTHPASTSNQVQVTVS